MDERDKEVEAVAKELYRLLRLIMSRYEFSLAHTRDVYAALEKAKALFEKGKS